MPSEGGSFTELKTEGERENCKGSIQAWGGGWRGTLGHVPGRRVRGEVEDPRGR